MTISLCMIVKNEAVSLPRCLNSAKALVDEIIVLDTGSSDGTADVARQWGAQVLPYDWQGDFAAARNASLAQATADWILVLDADEALTPTAAAMLQNIGDGQRLDGIDPDHLLLVNLLRQEIGAQQAPYSLVSRFFRNRPEIRFHRPYHETVDDSILALQAQAPHWQIATLPEVALHHWGYQSEAIAQHNKFERARTAMETYLASCPDDAYMLNKLAALYGQESGWEKGLPLLQRALQLPNTDELTRYELHYHLGLASRHLGDAVAAQQAYLEALAQPIDLKLKLGAQINLGSLLIQQGQFADAIRWLEQATAIEPGLAIIHYNLGLALRGLGRLDLAVEAYQQAIQLAPDAAEAHQNLGVTLFKLGRLPQALAAFSQAIQLYEEAGSAEANRLKAGIQQLNLPVELLEKAQIMLT